MKPRLAIIYWTDAAVHGNEQLDPEDESLCRGHDMKSHGVIVKKTDEDIIIAMDDCLNGEFRTFETIPRSLITKIIYPIVK
jgi:hypothetical protein